MASLKHMQRPNVNVGDDWYCLQAEACSGDDFEYLFLMLHLAQTLVILHLYEGPKHL